MALRDDILAAFPGLTPATRDDGAIAARLSQGRVKTVKTIGGIGSILTALGPEAGGAFLNTCSQLAAQDPAVKWGLQMIQSAAFDFGSPLAVAQANAFVTAGVLTQDQANALIAIAVVPDPVSVAMVAQALEGHFDGQGE